MSNTPFKIAFWVMCLAFGLTVLLTGLKPEEIRAALNPEATQPRLFDSRLQFNGIEETTTLPAQTSYPKLSSSAATRMSAPMDTTPPAAVPPASAAAPFRIALSGPLPKLPATTESTSQSSSPSMPPAFQHNAEPVTQRPAPRATPVERLVPTPMEYLDHEATAADVVKIQREIHEMRLADVRRELEDLKQERRQIEADQIREQLTKIQEDVRQLTKRQAASLPGERVERPRLPEIPIQIRIAAAGANETVAQLPPPPVVDQMPIQPLIAADDVNVPNDPPETTFEISTTPDSEFIDCEFENADIRDVLQQLGSHAGWRIVVEKAITGTYDGEFHQLPADQAFVSVIKANNFGVSFRGNYVFVRAKKDARIR